MPIWTALRERSLETVTSRNDNALVDLSLDGSFGAFASSLRDVVARIAHDQIVVAIKALMEVLPDVLSARVAKLAQKSGLNLARLLQRPKRRGGFVRKRDPSTSARSPDLCSGR